MADGLLAFLLEVLGWALGDLVAELLWRARWLVLALVCVGAAVVAARML